VLHYKKANEKIPARETKTMMAFEGYLLLGLLVLLAVPAPMKLFHSTGAVSRQVSFLGRHHRLTRLICLKFSLYIYIYIYIERERERERERVVLQV
jgi:hypothetical protein